MSAVVDIRTPMVNATRFRAAHEMDWDALDKIVTIIERRGVKAVPDEALLRLPALYRSALSSLSVARETSLDRSLIVYLEQLSTRAYFQIYGVQTSAWRQLGHFFARGWPQAVQSLWKETLVSLAILVVGAVVGFIVIRADPSLFYTLMPGQLVQGRDTNASAAELRETLYSAPKGANEQSSLVPFALQLFTNNASVSIFAFALGFMLCVPTIWLILNTGLQLGALIEVFAAKGLTVGILGWLSIHGTTELFAIILAGAAGFRIGLATAFPGNRSRMDAAVVAGRSAALVAGGSVIMLIFAALLEGIGRQTVVNDGARFLIGGGMLVGWLLYFYMPRKATDGAV